MNAETPLIPVGKARAELSELCSRVAYSGQRVVITRHGRPLVGIVPLHGGYADPATQTSTVIQASLDVVWDAITVSRGCTWWPGLSVEPFRGGWVSDGLSDDFGEVLEVDPGELMRTRWPDQRDEVDFTLARNDGSITLTVAHRMDPEFWTTKLADLKRYCEAQPG
jgi:prevent-host-death family protein